MLKKTVLIAIILFTAVYSEIKFHGLVNVDKSALLRFFGTDSSLTADSCELASIKTAIIRTGAFDTVVMRAIPTGNGKNELHFFLQERKKVELGLKGAYAGLSMFGETQLWASISPGLEIRHMFGRPQSLSMSISFPFLYGATLHWREYGLPYRTMSTGFITSAYSTPSINAPYYQRSGSGTFYFDNYFTPRFSARISGTKDISRTWKIVNSWEADRMAVLAMDPERISNKNSTIFPRTEEAASWAVSANLDLRDNFVYPSTGTHSFVEGRHYSINQRAKDYTCNFNQITASFKGYANPSGRQIAALHLKTVIRDKRFDNVNLQHRMLFHDETVYFYGFSGIAGTNIIIANLEYRLRIFKVDMETLIPELNLSPALTRHAKKLSYQGDLFAFLNNGAYFGRVITNKIEDVSLTELSRKDLFTSTGIGARLIYPKLGYVLTAALTFVAHKEGFDDDFFRPSAAASLSF